jgi:isoquinoline 1-oxidoreductase beta subunit
MMGVKRRAFLIGSALVAGGGVFGIKWADSSARERATALTTGAKDGSFGTWIKVGEDSRITIYTPHIDMGTGTSTALAQMVADELDADWDKVSVESAPAETAFANSTLARGFLSDMSGKPGMVAALPESLLSLIARAMPLQITGGSSAVRFTGQMGMRVVAAAARLALVEEAAEKLGVPTGELTTAGHAVRHAKSGKSLSYGELAAGAATRTLAETPALKAAKDYRFIGKPVPRLDIPAKVDGTARYGIDVNLPDMRVATVMAAPVRGGKLESVDEKPALAVKGVEKVVKLDDAVAVVATGYWPAIKGLRSLSPRFSDGGNGSISTASIFAAHDALRKGGDPGSSAGEGDVEAGLAADGAKLIEARYQVPFLHHAPMEPFALVAQFKDGKLDVWGGLQDPLFSKMAAVKASGLGEDAVTFHPLVLGGGFGRKLPMYIEAIPQVVALAMDLPHPVKLIWSREEEVAQGAYRAQASSVMKAALGKDGKIVAWQNNFAQPSDDGGGAAAKLFYTIPAFAQDHYKHVSNQTVGSWRSVNATQHGFYNESFIDELAHAAGADPYQFRRAHLAEGGRHQKVLDAVAKAAGWGTPLADGHGRGIAIVECFGTICAHVIEASVKADGSPKVHAVWAAVDCGPVVNPGNAEAQVMGGIVMGLSAAIGEAITLDKGAVQQTSFGDYPILKMADSPPTVQIEFLNSDAEMGGLGEPGLPPAAPALANALFAVTGMRIRSLPLLNQAGAKA